jgi:hypothetical protein
MQCLGCAIRLRAPFVRSYAPGSTAAPAERPVNVSRFGYGDRAPKGLVHTHDILSIGMQYVMRSAQPEPALLIIGPHTDLDARLGLAA